MEPEQRVGDHLFRGRETYNT